MQQPDHMDEGGKRANRIGTAAEAEQEDDVAVLILLREESVGAENFIIQAVARGQFKNCFGILFQPRPCIVGTDRSDPRLVADTLRGVLLDDLKQLEDVREITLDLVARSVATNDDVFGHACRPHSKCKSTSSIILLFSELL